MTFRFGLRSKAALLGVHPDLIAVAYRALQLSTVDFTVTEGVRSLARQRQLFAEKKSKTLNSRHIGGFAIDVAALVGGKVTWDWAPYEAIAVAFKQAANELGIDLEWGGDWKTFKDGPHFQLSHAAYPERRDAAGGEQA
jgi:peptidoglycan L-alanyl-D-glutamate endopeptidase CwlK